MTIETFLRRLKQIDRRWRVNSSGTIRTGYYTCPICAVAEVEGNNFEQARVQIGLDLRMAERIAAAADDDCATNAILLLRRRLLRACGLTEKAK